LGEGILVGILEEFLNLLRDLCRAHYGDNLCSVVLFGSVARGDYGSGSDIDVLVVLKDAGGSFGSRMEEFFSVIKALRDSRLYGLLREEGLPHKVQPVILSLEELKAHPPLLLDLTTDARVLLDREGAFAEEMEAVKARMRELGSRKVVIDGKRWYWILKPDIKRGEVVEI